MRLDCLFGYTGRAYDKVSGLQNNLNRWYDSSVGSWISQDPAGFDGGDTNEYRYVGDSPTNGVDPSGLTKGGRQNIKVTGIPSNVTVKELEQIIAKAEAAGASARHIAALKGWLKVLKRAGKFAGPLSFLIAIGMSDDAEGALIDSLPLIGPASPLGSADDDLPIWQQHVNPPPRPYVPSEEGPQG